MYFFEFMILLVFLICFCCCLMVKLMVYNSYNSYFKGKDKIFVNLFVNCYSIYIVFYCSVVVKLRKIKRFFFIFINNNIFISL